MDLANLIICLASSAVCSWLYRDFRRERRNASEWARLRIGREGDILARLARQDQRLEHLERVSLSGSPVLASALAPPRPSRSAAAVAAQVKELRGETKSAPVDTEGDRSADHEPVSVDEIAARITAATASRAAAPVGEATVLDSPPSSRADEEGVETRFVSGDAAALALGAALATAEPPSLVVGRVAS